MGKRKHEFDGGGFGRRQTLQLDRNRVNSREPAPWETDGSTSTSAAQPASALPTTAAGQVWQEVPDPESGDSYYWNVQTGETRWDRPPEAAMMPASSLPRAGSEESTGPTSAGVDTPGVADEGTSQAHACATQSVLTESATVTAESTVAVGKALAAFDYGSDSEEEEVVEGGVGEVGAAEDQTAAMAAERIDKGGAGVVVNGGGRENGGHLEGTREDRKPVQFALPKVAGDKKIEGVVERGEKALEALRPVKDSDVDDFLEELAAAPPASAVTTTALAAAGGVSAVTSGESLGRGSTLEAAGGDEEEESCDERGRGGQGAGGNGELGGSGEGGSGQGEGEGGTDVSPSPAAMEAEQNATGGGADQVDTEVMGRVCFAVLTLKREGDAIIESLKDAIAEEPVGGEGGAGARREVLLTLLGGMLSWSGLVSDLGILVSDQMTNAFARSVEIMLPKLRLRLEKCASALAAQDAQRQEALQEILPEGWCRATVADGGIAGTDAVVGEAGGAAGGAAVMTEASSIYFRVSGSPATPHSVQTVPPAATRYKPFPAYGADGQEEGAAEAEADGEAEKGAAVHEVEGTPEYETAHKETLAALPACSGTVMETTLLMYMTPTATCTVDKTLELLQPSASTITTMRIIGGGFVAVTFDSEFSCQAARDECILRLRGRRLGYPPLAEWTVVTGGDGSSGGTYARQAGADDQVTRYPVHFSQARQHTGHQTSQSGAAVSGGDPFSDAGALGGVEGGAEPGSGRGNAGERGKGVGMKGKGFKGKASAGLNKQILKWKRKQEELLPDDEEERQQTVEELEEEKRKKAADWYAEQLAAGGADANPNLMPIGYKPQSLGARGKQTHHSARNDCFAVPAPIASKDKKDAGWRDRLAGKL